MHHETGEERPEGLRPAFLLGVVQVNKWQHDRCQRSHPAESQQFSTHIKAGKRLLFPGALQENDPPTAVEVVKGQGDDVPSGEGRESVGLKSQRIEASATIQTSSRRRASADIQPRRIDDGGGHDVRQRWGHQAFLVHRLYGIMYEPRANVRAPKSANATRSALRDLTRSVVCATSGCNIDSSRGTA